MEQACPNRQNLQRVVLAAALTGLMIIVAALALIAWATTSVDALEKRKEEALVQRRLDRSLSQIVEDVNSASIWNDTVVALNGAPDLTWLQLNLGDYYADYMHHAVTLVFDPQGRLILASRDSEPVPAAREAAFTRAVAPLVAEARRASAGPERRGALGFGAAFNRSAIVRVGAETWLVGVSTIVPEDLTVARPAVDPVVVSAKPMSSLLASLESDLAITDPRYAPAGAAAPASVAVRDRSGRPIGALVWTPDLPGRGLLIGAAPIMIGVILLLIAGAVILFLWIGRVSRALAANAEALIEARDRAEAANEAKSRFLANMSHELRTPLNGVIGMAEVMAVGDLTPPQRENLGLLRHAAGSLTQLIEQILQVARLERNDVLVRREAFDLAGTIRTAVERHREAASAKGLALTSDCQAFGLRTGDAAHLEQVISNLVKNAVIYTPAGEVKVRAVPIGDGVRITVSDTGMGIPDELKPTLFDTFVQGDDSLTKRFGGAGLGLAICRNLVEAMGGEISIASETGRGAVFTVDLPLPAAEIQPGLEAA